VPRCVPRERALKKTIVADSLLDAAFDVRNQIRTALFDPQCIYQTELHRLLRELNQLIDRYYAQSSVGLLLSAEKRNL